MVLVARPISGPQLRPTLVPIPASLVPIPTTIRFLQSQCIRTPKRNLHCRCVPSPSSSSLEDWDWNRWTRHFSQIEHAESFASLLQFQLEDAIEKEDFREAARVKRAITEATSEDTVAEIMSLLKNAIDEERYHDASRLCRCSGSGLIGWWVGYSKDSDDPFGRIIHISPGMGRFVGRSYSPRQLITGSPGTPIFEIYVVKDADDTYHMQVVYLRRAKGNSMSNPPSSPAKSPSKPEVENTSSVEMQEGKEKVEINDEKNRNIEGTTEEGIKSVINFLKEKIPGLKVKVMNVNVEEEGAKVNDSIKQFMQESSNKTSSSENPGEESNDLDTPDEVTFGTDSDVSGEKNLDTKLFIGGVVHNNDDTPAKDDYMRLPAEIEDMERDSFLLHIPKSSLDYNAREHKLLNLNMAALAAQGVSELMPSDIAKAFWASDKVSSKFQEFQSAILNFHPYTP
ncbi:executer 1 [Stylosanthes scabra]|uniref:Executer 1 n=1 Tax=Stylosanthes scabra TaxID=79078 RepID=A0ABU6RLD7_9FABA|nr:executer 1 [Stylosanthes scabra]